MATLVSYDVRTNHTAFKNNLVQRGFYYCMTLNDQSRKKMPNTTLFHQSDIVADVEALFKAAAAATFPNPGIEKYLLINGVNNFNLISDETC